MPYHHALDRLITDIHANIEKAAEKAVLKIQMGELGVGYPPNGGLSTKEKKAVGEIDLESEQAALGLKKIIADATYSVVYRMLLDIDGTSSPEYGDGEWWSIKWYYHNEKKPINEHGILTAALGDGYWNWVKVRDLDSPRMDSAKIG